MLYFILSSFFNVLSLRSRFHLYVGDFKRSFIFLKYDQVRLPGFSVSVRNLWPYTKSNYETKFVNNKIESQPQSIDYTPLKPTFIWQGTSINYFLATYAPLYFQFFQVTQHIFWIMWRSFLGWFNVQKLKARGEGLIFIICLFGVTYIDALITDDEPLTEPVEWSLIQSWIMIIFGLSWIAENLISSRYGSYTGRDKRVWFSWYKTFWFVEGWYVLSFGAAALFVITPFYNELSYNLTMAVGWWHWYTRVFFFTFLSLFTIILYISYYAQLTLRYTGWKHVLFYVTLVNIVLGYLLYGQFLISFFSYTTDPNWYHKSRLVDYIQLSHEPNKWSWGNAKRDHFSYHRSTTVFWFKTDLPIAAALLIFNIFFFICLFCLYIYWVVLFRRIYTTKEVTYTYLTYCVSALRQFFYFFLLLYILVYFSYLVAYLRLPIELLWVLNLDSWLSSFYFYLSNYPSFIISLFL